MMVQEYADVVLEVLGDEKPRSFEEISKATGLPIDLVKRIINILEITNLVNVYEEIDEAVITKEGIKFLSLS